MGATAVVYRSQLNDLYFKHVPGVAKIYSTDRYQQFYGIVPELVTPEDIDFSHPNIIPFLSEKKKVFMSLMNGPYHFLNDVLGPTLYMIEQYPDAQYIFEISKMYHFDNSYMTHFFKTLHDKKIDFKPIAFKQGDIIVANNFYYFDVGFDYFDNGNRLYKFFENDYIKDQKKPFRKLYLSRKMMKDRDYTKNLLDGPTHKHDNRIINEPLLEEFLKNEYGFEIIVPEEFENFSQQIKHYNEAKTIVSVTSSGLTPACAFTQPGSTIVELMNTMVVPLKGIKNPEEIVEVEEALHLFYVTLSFNRGHNFISIPNKNRRAEDIIEIIKRSKSLRSVFEE